MTDLFNPQPSEIVRKLILKSPNREVGDRSFQPTENAPTDDVFKIPQPGGWGFFILAYKRTRRPTKFSITPNWEVGDCSFQPTENAPTDDVFNNPQPAGWGM